MTATPAILANSAEEIEFGMDRSLLADVIMKQAGTIQKAIMEGVMNGVDAGATRIDITLDGDRLIIVDNGKGFQSREDILKYFGVFGTPHKKGDAVFGRYRMGRGQLMAYGVNNWISNGFRMFVDIKNLGLRYKLEEIEEQVSGCRIEIDLYSKLLPSALDRIKYDLKSWIAYVECDLNLNGKPLTKRPSQEDWDFETDEAYFRLSANKGTLDIYNLGVIVTNSPAQRYGTGGIVVSKQQLDVNFARNEIMSTCEVFTKIKQRLDEHAGRIKSKSRLSDAERQKMARQIIAGEIPFVEACDLRVLTDVEGKHLPLSALSSATKIALAPRGHDLGKRIHMQRFAVVIASETVERFDMTSLAELIEALGETAAAAPAPNPGERWDAPSRIAGHFADSLARLQIVDLASFAHLVSNKYEPIPDQKLDKKTRALLRVARSAMWLIAIHLSDEDNIYQGARTRSLHAGRSDVAAAWTDGHSRVWITVEKLKLISKGYAGLSQVANILIHEYLHDSASAQSHDHDLEFYERFHNLVVHEDLHGRVVKRMASELASDIRRADKRLPQATAYFEDIEAKVINAGGAGSPQDAAEDEIIRLTVEAMERGDDDQLQAVAA